ncbi:MFS transporter [Kitasatospora phosalacinea]|uniref:MFS transporter n=1 Tax=Kitasatospora phosalacinea TaxID=2065 RepID=A0A9W6Q6E9_9ACTN|nr:MFS transporter [Kitasatospora phosalacinea]GLW70777.1 MFS transporter [Kitasatospora phosalacinea]
MTDTPTTTAPPHAGPPAADDRLPGRARLALCVLCAAQFIIALDFSILNVALPVLGNDLGMDDGDLQWAVTAFALPSGGFLLLFGRVADLYGRLRIFTAGLVLFTLASVLATFAWDTAPFLAARALQGLGAAAVVPTGMSLLTTTFPEGPQRNRALGINGTLLSLGYTVGMLLSGVMTDRLGWRSTMALLAACGLLVTLAVPVLRPAARPEQRPRLDLPGAVTVTGGLLCVIYALSTAGQDGFGQADVIATLALGVLLLAAFVAIELRAPQPLVSLGMLRRATVAFGNLGGLATFSMMSSLIFLLTLYFQEQAGLSAFRTSLVFAVQGVVLAATGTAAPRIVGALGARTTLVAGLAVQGAFTAGLLLLSGHGDVPLAVGFLVLASVGHMCAVVSYGINATSGLPAHEQGLASGLVTSAQQLGITIGIPILGALAAGRAAHQERAGHDHAAAQLDGTLLGVGTDTTLVLLAALLIGLGLRRRTKTG